MSVNIERALLGSFLWSNDLGMDTKDAFILDTSLFTSDDRKLIASKINETTDTEDRFYSLLNMEIEQTSSHEWMEIAALTPFIFSLSKRYHEYLIEKRNDRIILGVA
ncbi:hypothetical protein PF327_10890 [Sulfurovum sp. XTW-4]|uniref:Uncharacterized protein n=1 Tax=Sulfurovum xiamenensis TaxID=3019066 RepID=A0ABT7QUJ5_9BACT|nr:hypothetical protein [Sulfurovum xiamenensis]MDM5264701.1 hypothetical protein [Sulfurovum xiamenensis]